MDLRLYKQRFIENAKESVADFDERLISEAFDFADEAHRGQKRDSGNYYIEHPIRVANILLDFYCDSETIAAALLHDAVEDTEFTIKNIKDLFGEDVAFLVEGVTKIPPLFTIFDPQKAKEHKEHSKKESIRKLFRAIIEDYRVAIIKLSDRVQNLRTLGGISSPKKRKRIASESLLIYAPLAEALGYEKFQKEIQEKAFRHYKPDVYEKLKRKVKEKEKSVRYKDARNQVIDTIEERLQEETIQASVYGRRKEIYSIYKKMETLGLEFDEVYDVIGVRVIVNTVEECYHTLAVTQKLGKFRIDDYIENPRPPFNYQSLHAVIINERWGKVEIQIRTQEMHEIAEKGPASHWKYKLKDTLSPEIEKRLVLLREALSSIDEKNDNLEDIQEILKQSLAPFITVYTPKHESIFLPSGATPLDFAYSVHTEIGHQCVAAKVNKKLVRLDYRLRNLDEVEIISKKGEEPKISWIVEDKVFTPKAKQKILSYLKKQKKKEIEKYGEGIINKHLEICANYNIEQTKLWAELLNLYKISQQNDLFVIVANDQRNVKKFITSLGEIILKKLINEIGFPKSYIDKIPKAFFALDKDKFSDNTKSSLHFSIGSGNVSSEELRRFLEHVKREFSEHPEQVLTSKPINQELSTQFLINIPQCCYPVPGDDIIGFVTIGKGMSIHRKSCPNIIREKDTNRLLKVKWSELFVNKHDNYLVELIAMLINEHPSTYEKIQEIIKTNNAILKNLIPLGSSKQRNFQLPIALFLYVKDVQHLQMIINKLRKVDSIASVVRNFH